MTFEEELAAHLKQAELYDEIQAENQVGTPMSTSSASLSRIPSSEDEASTAILSRQPSSGDKTAEASTYLQREPYSFRKRKIAPTLPTPSADARKKAEEAMSLIERVKLRHR